MRHRLKARALNLEAGRLWKSCPRCCIRRDRKQWRKVHDVRIKDGGLSTATCSGFDCSSYCPGMTDLTPDPDSCEWIKAARCRRGVRALSRRNACVELRSGTPRRAGLRTKWSQRRKSCSPGSGPTGTPRTTRIAARPARLCAARVGSEAAGQDIPYDDAALNARVRLCGAAGQLHDALIANLRTPARLSHPCRVREYGAMRATWMRHCARRTPHRLRSD